jgi:nucleotide-binding universal stress UspA family protein
MTGGTIVCGVSETPEGRAAADLASALSQRLGLRLVLVSVIDGLPTGGEDSLTARQLQSGAERTLRDLAVKLGAGTETRLVHGPRAEALAQVAAEEGADAIVVGSRPTGLGNRKLRSTLARELEAVTPVPVLMAPPSTRRRSEHRLAVAAAANGR